MPASITYRAALAAVTFCLLSVVFSPALAEACEPTTSEAEVDAAGLVYVVGDRMCCSEFDVLWVYAEDNGIPGLQRGDEMVDDTCGGAIARDALVL